MKRLVLVRHGQTEWSASGRHTSTTDMPLTPEGEAQARRLRALLDELGLRPARVLCSPMERAKRTAELAGLTPFEPTAALLELDYGEYEGLTTPEILDRSPRWDLFRDGCPDGETVEQVGARLAPLLDGLAPETDGGDVVLVAHGHVLRVLTSVYLGEPPSLARAFALGTATVSVLGHEHAWRAVTLWNLGASP